MPSAHGWLFPLIEDSLSTFHYYGRDDPKIRLEDDGSNLRFTSTSQQHAFINSWSSEGESVPTVNLSDSLIQIDAILSPGSLEKYRRAFPDCPLGNEICRGRVIQLDDFELVFEYALAEAKLHLYVRRFSIVWARGKENRPPQGRLAKNSQPLSKLIRKVYKTVRLPLNPSVAIFKDDRSTDDSLPARASKIHEKSYSQGHMLSQVPPNRSPLPPLGPSNAGGVVASSKALLELMKDLEHRPSKETALSHRTSTSNAQPAIHCSLGDMNPSESSGLAQPTSGGEKDPATSKTAQKSSVKLGPEQSIDSGGPDALPPADRGPIPPKSSVHKEGKRLNQERKEVPAQEHAHQHDREGGEVSVQLTNSTNTSVGQQGLPRESSPVNVTLRTNPPRISHPIATSHWNGRTEIRSCEVTTLKDQCELLDHHDTRLWLPVPAGRTYIPGYIPSPVLNAWNRIASWRSDMKRREASKDFGEPGQPDSRHSQSKSLTPEVDSDSEEPLTSDWSDSASEGASRPSHRQLPLDSSPLGPRPVAKGATARGERLGTPKGDRDSDVAKPSAINEQPSEASPLANDRQASNRSPTTAPTNNDSRVNGENTSRPTARKASTPPNDPEHTSDTESDESVMEISVPRPLTEASQQSLFSQPEPGISSSGPSLPRSSARQIVQVLETPTAGLNRARTAPADKSNHKSPIEYPEQSSSQAGKSSSQSRVLNTYASHEGDSREIPSQEDTSKSAQKNGADNASQIHVVRTPTASDSLLTQDTTSWSGSGSVWKSSGPANSGSSIVVAIPASQSQHSNTFSSYRELPPSSLLSVEDDEGIPSVQSSMRSTPVGPTRALPPKRLASEIESIEEMSPSKRNKTSHETNREVGAKDIEGNILARRQRYLSHPAKSSVALGIYEKFQNDYPNYAGDFVHFTKLCFKLQQFRENGSLKRSFLWDDFIIQHHEGYLRYLSERENENAKSLEYEAFFASSFSKPSNKKRSLTPHSIDACASYYTSSARPVTPSHAPFEPVEAVTSFTSSLRDQLSNFHTHSFGPQTQDPPQHDAEIEESQSIYSISITESDPDCDPVADPATNQENDDNPDATDEENDSDDLMEDIHETASIELSGEDPPPAARARRLSIASASSQAPSEAESLNENWFLSLRHLRPTSPIWSDDPNTPFKQWARADQNVIVERYLRGGARMPEDEKGVIQHPSYRRQ